MAYLNVAAGATVTFGAHLADARTGLYYHGYNAATGDTSCCLWGRATAWALLAQVEVLTAMAAVAPSHPLYAKVRARFLATAAAMLAVQDGSGGWHQVLNDTTTFLETSVTAAALYAMTAGVMGGWLPQEAYDDAIQAAWAAVASTVSENGSVAGVSADTPILTSAAEYAALPTTFATAQPGLGVLLMATRSYYLYSSPE